MAPIPKEILLATNEYINKLKKQIPVSKVILFGSYAKGNFTKDSDIDLAVFSSAFEKMSRVDGTTFLLMQALEYKIDIQPQPYTMQDYHEHVGILDDILRTGIEIA